MVGSESVVHPRDRVADWELQLAVMAQCQERGLGETSLSSRKLIVNIIIILIILIIIIIIINIPHLFLEWLSAFSSVVERLLIAPICRLRLFSKRSKEGDALSLILKKLKTTTHLDPGPEGPRRSLRRLAPWRGAGDRTRRGGAEGAAPAPGGKFARCAPAGPGSRRSPGRGGAREARPGRARERKVPSGTRARAGIRAANEARVWAARGGGTGQNAAFAVAAAGALAASGAGGEATADRRAGRAPRPGPGVGNRAEELETFPAGDTCSLRMNRIPQGHTGPAHLNFLHFFFLPLMPFGWLLWGDCSALGLPTTVMKMSCPSGLHIPPPR
uniref:uncharacterized protein LOC132670987 n=1 Tax=Panthera onca TaxID=9690 RepID=UPI002954D94A|nr:uncharacterized protein LOC132670987 [Panthera onca]